jgi:hypothetical protein
VTKLDNRQNRTPSFTRVWLVRESTGKKLENFQLIKLKNVLFHVSEKSAFYRNLFQEQSIAANDVHSLSDLAKIPFTEPVNLTESPYKFPVHLSQISQDQGQLGLWRNHMCCTLPFSTFHQVLCNLSLTRAH